MQSNFSVMLRKTIEKYGEGNASFLLLLLVEAFSSSILNHAGIRLHYPIAILVDSMEAVERFQADFAIFDSELVNANDSPKSFAKSLTDNHDDFVMILYSPGRNCAENMENLRNIALGGCYEKRKLEAVPLVFFWRIVPPEYDGGFAMVLEMDETTFVDDYKVCRDQFLKEVRDFILTHFEVVRYELGRMKAEENPMSGKDFKFFLAGAKILSLVFGNGRPEMERLIMERLKESVENAYAFTEDYSGSYQLVQGFIEALCQFVSNGGSVIYKDQMDDFKPSEWQEKILYDEKFYYISEACFEKICLPMRQFSTLNRIKIALEKAEILSIQGQGRIYRTKKLKVGSGYDARYIWLERSKIDRDELSPSLVELKGKVE